MAELLLLTCIFSIISNKSTVCEKEKTTEKNNLTFAEANIIFCGNPDIERANSSFHILAKKKLLLAEDMMELLFLNWQHGQNNWPNCLLLVLQNHNLKPHQSSIRTFSLSMGQIDLRQYGIRTGQISKFRILTEGGNYSCKTNMHTSLISVDSSAHITQSIHQP